MSVIIVAKNAEKTLPLCLNRLAVQDYDLSKVEVLVVDGGSTDKTREIATANGAEVVNGGFPDNQEPRRYVGLLRSRNEIVLYLDSDNLMPNQHWLKDMTRPFDDASIMASFTQWYGIENMMSLTNRYYSMIGGNDPVVYYLGKNDRAPYMKNSLPRGAELVADRGRYLKVRFDYKKLPVIGCNGFLVRRDFLNLLKLKSPEQFFHIDIHVDLLRQYPDACYGIVKNDILHIAEHNLWAGVIKRLSYKQMHHDKFNKMRRYKVFDAGSVRDRGLLLWTIVCAATFVEPVFRSLLGFARTKNGAWFLHPIALFLMVGTYALSFILPGNGSLPERAHRV
ncbi:MAG: glycosyltransferase family A protein [Elusimicrobiales bacterium]